MTELIPVLDAETIAGKTAAVARQISRDYKDRELIVVGVLKGAFIFMADLVRQLDIVHLKTDFVRAASYGDNTQSSGTIRLTKDIDVDIKGKDVLVIEDILDTGLTLAFLIDHLNSFEPRSVKICTLIDKQERRQAEIQADYVGHTVNSGFLVGYGLDFAEEYRNLPGIYHLKQ